jgi:ADP-ribose pyrophosphatase YjhB (NUDIX family)
MSQNVSDFFPDKNQLIPQLSVDCVIFGFHNHQLKVLLLKIKNIDLWVLPGGYIFQDEDIENAALRVLEERTGLKDIYLEQFRTFGKPDRSTRESILKIMKDSEFDAEKNSWMLERFVTVGYYALVDFSKVKPQPDFISEACTWADVTKLPEMAFDHKEIVDKALETLRFMLDYKLVGLNLLPETFTMKELQILYETISGLQFRRNNFQRKMLSMDILERLEKKYTGAANKAPFLYKFKGK